ncbi:MAG: hypothetical protein DMG94_05155 [Acidobacteria bacterium]|nr:MAG: hypothetical protein DMG94_05155 [Acidobacteriota bacterium]
MEFSVYEVACGNSVFSLLLHFRLYLKRDYHDYGSGEWQHGRNAGDRYRQCGSSSDVPSRDRLDEGLSDSLQFAVQGLGRQFQPVLYPESGQLSQFHRSGIR